MSQNHKFRFYIKCIIVSSLLSIVAHPCSATESETFLSGRVWAVMEDWLPHTGMSDRFQYFVFGVESEDQEGNKNVSPVLIDYLNSGSDDMLPESFYHYSNVFELHVKRRPDDLPLESVALIKYMSADNEEAHPPDVIMRLLDGAPTDILNMDMVLPYYGLLPDGYRRIDSAEQSEVDASILEIMNNPLKYDSKVVRITAWFRSSPHSISLESDDFKRRIPIRTVDSGVEHIQLPSKVKVEKDQRYYKFWEYVNNNEIPDTGAHGVRVELDGYIRLLKNNGKLTDEFNIFGQRPIEIIPLKIRKITIYP